MSDVMDAAEIAELRELYPVGVGFGPTVHFLLDALERAQKERDGTIDDIKRLKLEVDRWRGSYSAACYERYQAQKDSKDAKDARALLEEISLEQNLHYTIRPRIEAMLERKL